MNSGMISTSMYLLQALYTIHLIIRQLIFVRQLYFMDVNLSNHLISQVQDAMLRKFGENKQRLLDSYQVYRSYYDQKAEAHSLKLHSHCLLLYPRLTRQNDYTQ